MAIQHIEKPTKRTFWKISEGDIVHEGYTEINQVTSTGLDTVKQSQDPAAIYPALPNTGLLRLGKTYSWDGKMVRVEIEHERTEFPPDLTPNLFSIVRPNNDGTWIEQEEVEIGDERTYNGVEYICIIGHVTEFTPDQVPNLWKIKLAEITDWYQPAGAQDAFRIDQLVRYSDGKVYKSLIDYNTYSPTAYPAGWEWQPDLT